MADMNISYFANLFTADPSLQTEPVINLIDSRVTDDVNDGICAYFSEKEISDALFQTDPLKAPGPDGFPARIFQWNWAVMKEHLIAGVKEFFWTGLMPDGVNNTSIVLIPKVDKLAKLTDFCPISLCNVIYKVVAKCLVNRLRPILDDIISPAQSAFVPARMITDTAYIAFECIHHIQQKKDPAKSFYAHKLDLSKACDRVDWTFLKQMMQKLGFAHRWIGWIMTCVTTVRYNVKFNGTLLDSFALTRGLRQGDPLSPFLFLFFADGLSALLKDSERRGNLVPLKICMHAAGTLPE